MLCLLLFYASLISFCYLAPLKPSLFLATVAFAGLQQYTVQTCGDFIQDLKGWAWSYYKVSRRTISGREGSLFSLQFNMLKFANAMNTCKNVSYNLK